jgi:hypothetical protein
MPVYKYLDLSTGHLTRNEGVELSSAYPYGDLDHSPRVIVHDYGAWVNVPDLDGSWDAEDQEALRSSRPNLADVIDHARELGCTWINFDRDAEPEEGLPVHDW